MFRPLVRTPSALVLLIALAAPAAAGQAAPAVAPPSSPQPATPGGAPRTLTLDEALALAEAKNESVLIAEAGVRKAAGGIDQAKSQRLPQLTGTAAYERTLKSEFAGLFDSSSFGGGDNTDGGSLADLPFGQANAHRLGLSFSQLIWAGGRERAIVRQARLGRDAAALSLTSAKAQLSLDVAQAFYDAALADRLVAISEEAYAQASRAYDQTKAKADAGRVSEFELLRAQVDRDTQRSPVVRAGATRDVAYLRLKQLLDLPLATPIQLAAQLDDPRLVPAARFSTRLAEAEATPAPRTRTAVTQADYGLQVNEEAVKIADAQKKPAFALQSSYGLVNYHGFPGFDDWRTNWTVGLGMQIPLLTGGRIKAEQGMARADVDAAKARLQLTKELSDLDDASVRAALGAARAEWEASGGIVQQASRAYEIAELRFREGLSTQLELSDARLLLAQAQVQRSRAARDLQMMRVRLALLPELPLGTGAGMGADGAGAAQSSAPSATVASPTQGTGSGAATGTPAAAGTQGVR